MSSPPLALPGLLVEFLLHHRVIHIHDVGTGNMVNPRAARGFTNATAFRTLAEALLRRLRERGDEVRPSAAVFRQRRSASLLPLRARLFADRVRRPQEPNVQVGVLPLVDDLGASVCLANWNIVAEEVRPAVSTTRTACPSDALVPSFPLPLETPSLPACWASASTRTSRRCSSPASRLPLCGCWPSSTWPCTPRAAPTSIQ